MDIHPPKFIPSWLAKLLGSAIGVVCICAIMTLGCTMYLVGRQEAREARRDYQMRIVLANVQVLHEQTTIRNILSEKLPKLSPELQAKLALEFHEAGIQLGCPAWLLLAIADKESSWNPNAVSSAGAVGLMHVMPRTALDLATGMGISIKSIDQIREPLLNVRLGIRCLANNYRAAVMQGKSPEGDFTRSLYVYNGLGESYARLVMEKAPAYQKRLAEAQAGRVAVLTPMPK